MKKLLSLTAMVAFFTGCPTIQPQPQPQPPTPVPPVPPSPPPASRLIDLPVGQFGGQ